MTATYDPTLPADKDHVRFLTGDTDPASPVFQDEEIAAVLSEELATGKSLKYYAAARCLSVMLTRFSTSGKGLVSKTVSHLSKTWGVAGTTPTVIEARIKELRERGAYIMSRRPFPLRTTGGGTRGGVTR